MKIKNGVLSRVKDSDIQDGQFIFPTDVTSIDEGAFYNCKSLTSIIIPENVTSIGESAFYDCENLTSIVIPKSVTSIERRAFYNCNNVTSVIIPETVTSIDQEAFYNCKSLTSITIPEQVTYIGERAFFECESLTSIVIPKGVTFIGEETFSGCSNLTSIVIPESITHIGNNAFDKCTRLSVIRIEANDEESYLKIFSQLPQSIQDGMQAGFESFKEQAKTILASYRGAGFFNEVTVPKEIIYKQLFFIAKKYGVPSFRLTETCQKFGIGTEEASANENRADLGN